MFTRLANLNAPPEELRGQVDGFTLHGSERLVVLNVSQQGKSQTVLHDLTTGEERMLPVEQPSKSLGLRGDTLIWTQRAGAGRPTGLHYLNIISGEGQSYELPEGIPDVATLVNRGSGSLVFDSKGTDHLRPEGTPLRRHVAAAGRPLVQPRWSIPSIYRGRGGPAPAGDEPAPRGGSCGCRAPPTGKRPRACCRPGDQRLVGQPAGFGLRPEDPDFPMFFWARYGLGGSDLYMANHETGAVMKVANGIGSVAIGERHLLGIVRLGQDQTGDLIYREFFGNREQVIEHGCPEMTIASFEELGELVAFVVRERMDSSPRNGLWATMLRPLAPKTAGRGARRAAGPGPWWKGRGRADGRGGVGAGSAARPGSVSARDWGSRAFLPSTGRRPRPPPAAGRPGPGPTGVPGQSAPSRSSPARAR